MLEAVLPRMPSPKHETLASLTKTRRVLITVGAGENVVRLLPPLIITEADAKYFLTAFEDVMVQMHKFPGPAWDVLMGIGKMAITQRAR